MLSCRTEASGVPSGLVTNFSDDVRPPESFKEPVIRQKTFNEGKRVLHVSSGCSCPEEELLQLTDLREKLSGAQKQRVGFENISEILSRKNKLLFFF